MWRTSRGEKPSALICRNAVSRSRNRTFSSAGQVRLEPRAGRQSILKAIARIDQHQPAPRLNQQAMRGDAGEQAATGAIEEGAAERAVRSAVEVMDAHGDAPLAA
jgi:hypothetical protein